MSGTPVISTLTEGLAGAVPIAIRGLDRAQVACRGITGVTARKAADAVRAGGRLKHVAALAFTEPDGAGLVTARVRPEFTGPDDPLARVDGTANAVICRASPLGEVTITGPGAGPHLAGQGC